MFFALVYIVLFSQEKNTNGTEYITSYRGNTPNKYENEKFSFNDVDYYYGSLPYQLPEELLPEFTAEELLFFCLDHPELQRSNKRFFKSVLSFNGLQELLSRHDFLEAFRKNTTQYLIDVIEFQKRERIGYRSKEELKRVLLFEKGIIFFLSQPFINSLDEDLKLNFKKTLNQIAEDIKKIPGGYYYPFVERAFHYDEIQRWLLSEYNQTPFVFITNETLRLPYLERFHYKNGTFLFPNMRYDGSLTIRDYEQKKDAINNLPYQLPPELLPELTTEELLYYFADHPCFKTNTPELVTNFNGYNELIRRKNVIEQAGKVAANYASTYIDKSKLDSRILSFFFSKSLWDVLDNSKKIEHLSFVLENHPKFSDQLYHFFSREYPEERMEWGIFEPSHLSSIYSAVVDFQEELTPEETEQKRIKNEKETKERMEKQVKYLIELINRYEEGQND